MSSPSCGAVRWKLLSPFQSGDGAFARYAVPHRLLLLLLARAYGVHVARAWLDGVQVLQGLRVLRGQLQYVRICFKKCEENKTRIELKVFRKLRTGLCSRVDGSKIAINSRGMDGNRDMIL